MSVDQDGEATSGHPAPGIARDGGNGAPPDPDRDGSTAGGGPAIEPLGAAARSGHSGEPVVLAERADWEHFGPSEGEVSGTGRGLARRVGRVLGHEWTLAVLGGVLLAIVMFWPSVRHPASTIPMDIWDPTLQAWQMAWAGHALSTDPTQLWNANAFYPDQYSYAFSDTLFGYFPAGLIGSGPTAALVRYNVMFLLLHALAFTGGYALARQLGARRVAAAVAGAAFAYAPWRWGQAGHMHVLSVGGIALSLAMLARGHGFTLRDGWHPERSRPRWAFVGWLTAAWQISLGFGIGLPFAYVLAGLCVVGAVATARRWWRASRHAAPEVTVPDITPPDIAVPDIAVPDIAVPEVAVAERPAPTPVPPLRAAAAPPDLDQGPGLRAGARRPGGLALARHLPRALRRLLLADLVGVLVFGAVAVFMARPYFQVLAAHPYAKRSIADLRIFSPGLRGLVTAPAQSWLWGPAHAAARQAMVAPAETTLLPGFVLIGLAVAGLFLSVWRLRIRLGLFIAAAVTVALTLGTHGLFHGEAGYVFLYRFLPGWDAIRTPGRLVIWLVLLLGLLAAGAVSALEERAHLLAEETRGGRISPLNRLVLLLPLLLVLVEGANTMDHPVVPRQPAAMRTAPGPLLVLPSDQLTDEDVMLWSTSSWPKMINGGSGFTPLDQAATRDAMRSFPDAASVARLRELGIRTVIVLEHDEANPWNADFARAQDPGAPIDGLDITRSEQDGVIVYTISR